MVRHNQDGRGSLLPPRLACNRAQRLPVQVIEMSVRYQHHIHRRQIADAQARLPQPLQYEQPAREVGIDDHALSANLQEETRVADEGDAEFSVGGEARFVGLAATWSYRGVTHQTSKLGGAFTKGRIAKRLLNHPATEPGVAPEAASTP
jgi:hypothetical protein